MEKMYVWKYNGEVPYLEAKNVQYVYFIPVEDNVDDRILFGQSDVDPLLLPFRACSRIPLSSARTIWKELQEGEKYSLLQRGGQ